MHSHRDRLLAALGGVYLLLVAAAAWGGGAAVPLPIDLYLCALGAVFLVYAGMVRRLLRRRLSVGVSRWLMGVAVLARLIVLSGPHRANSDLARYLWYGHVLASGVNPYAHAPADPALVPLREGAFFASLNPAYNHIRTVYGPLAEVWFALCARLPGNRETLLRTLMTCGDLLTVWLLVLLLRQVKRPEEWALVYALNPLLLDSFAQRGQMDGLLLPCLAALALLLGRKEYGLAGGMLAAGALVKISALVLAPTVLCLAWRDGRRAFRSCLLGLAVVAAPGSLPLLAAGFEGITGILTFAADWRANASIFALIETAAGGGVARWIALIGVGAGVVLACRLCRSFPRGKPGTGNQVCVLVVPLLALLLFAPAVFPWYVTWLLPFSPLLLGLPRWRRIGWAVLCWSGTVCLWYLRFLVYPPLAAPRWPEAAARLRGLSAFLAEPWRVVEYAPVALLLGFGLAHALRREEVAGTEPHKR